MDQPVAGCIASETDFAGERWFATGEFGSDLGDFVPVVIFWMVLGFGVEGQKLAILVCA